MTLPDRSARLARLTRSIEDPLKNNKQINYTRIGQEKLGETHNNIVLQHGKMESANTDPSNPGFTFSADGSELRTGSSLKITTPFDRVSFAGKALNPIMEFTPPNIASWYPMFIPYIDDLSDLTKTAQALGGLL